MMKSEAAAGTAGGCRLAAESLAAPLAVPTAQVPTLTYNAIEDPSKVEQINAIRGMYHACAVIACRQVWHLQTMYR